MQKEEALPSDIFPHVYSFLVRFGFLKSAKLFRKETNVPRVVVDSPGLLDFYEAFKSRKKKVDALKTDETVASKKKRKAEKQLAKKVSKKKKKKQTSSSEPGSEEEGLKTITKKLNDTKKKQNVVSVKARASEEESSSSDSEPTKSNGVQGGAEAPSVLPKHKKIAAAVKKSASSSSEDSSSEEEGDDPASSTTAKQSQKDGDSSTSDSSEAPTPKKPIPIAEPHTLPKANKKPKAKPTGTQPFCRIDKQTVVDPKLTDNSFEAKSGAKGSWGEKAHHVLKNTKGRSFRHEKTKKKRGSYIGGKIDTNVHSIKFDDSD